MSESIVEVKDLRKLFPVRGGVLGLQTVAHVHAVDRITFDIRSGETLGLVGESGCGKTTTSRLILGIIEPTEGEVRFMGENLFKIKGKKLRNLKREFGVVFQDPFTSLCPRMTIKEIVSEPLDIHKIARGRKKSRRIIEVIESVGLEEAQISRYPHEFSGGQKQRIAIARALASNPKFIVADEPVTAVDVSIRAEILNLMKDLQKKLGLTYLFISHDLSVVRYICNRVAVMYLGKMAELGPVRGIYDNPQHPYTQALMSANPIPDPTVKKKRIILTGDVPTPIYPPSGCRFHPRCWMAEQICSEKEPEFEEKKDGRYAACHLI